jgi:hypothetical protein
LQNILSYCERYNNRTKLEKNHGKQRKKNFFWEKGRVLRV